MIRSALIVVLGLLLFFPAAQAEEKYELNHCFSGTGFFIHENKDLPALFTYKQDGIIISKSESKFLDNVSTHCEGIGIVRGAETKVTSYCIAVDPDGDWITWGGPWKEDVIKREFNEGTGKYKGLKGTIVSEKLAATKKQVKPGTFQECRKLTGTFEMAPQ